MGQSVTSTVSGLLEWSLVTIAFPAGPGLCLGAWSRDGVPGKLCDTCHCRDENWQECVQGEGIGCREARFCSQQNSAGDPFPGGDSGTGLEAPECSSGVLLVPFNTGQRLLGLTEMQSLQTAAPEPRPLLRVAGVCSQLLSSRFHGHVPSSPQQRQRRRAEQSARQRRTSTL